MPRRGRCDASRKRHMVGKQTHLSTESPARAKIGAGVEMSLPEDPPEARNPMGTQDEINEEPKDAHHIPRSACKVHEAST